MTQNPGTVQLKSKQGPVAKLVVITAIALFWNSIVAMFAVQIVWHLKRRAFSGCELAFFTPFALIGVLLIVGIVYQVLALANPRPEVTLSSATIPLGGGAEVKWRFSGRYDRITRLHVYLEGREEATYTRGTDTRTDRSVFFCLDVADTIKPFEIAIGSGKFAIPADTMHTFTARHNKIVWELKVRGEIPKWPDVKEDFTLQILPPAHASAPPPAFAMGGTA